MQRLSNKISHLNFDFLLRVLLEMTAACDRDQLMEISDRLHERRRRMAFPERHDDDLVMN